MSSSLHQKMMIAMCNREIEEINADLQPCIACADFAEAKLYTDGVIPLSVRRKLDGAVEVTTDEEVAHLKHLVQKSANEEFIAKDDNDAWL